MSDKGSGIIKSIGLLASGRLAIMVVNFVTTAVLARLVSPSEFGVMAAVLIIIALSDSVFTGAFGLGVTQKKEIDNAYLTVVYFMAIGVSALFVLLVWLGSGQIQQFFHFSTLGAGLTVAALAFPFRASDSVTASLLRRRGRFKALASYQFFCPTLVYGPVSIGLAFLGWGMWALILGNLALSIASAVCSFGLAQFHRELCSEPARLRPAFGVALEEEFLGKNVFVLLSSLLTWAALTGPNAVIGRFSGAVPLGLYARSWRLLDLVTGLTATPINNVLLSTFSRMQDDAAASARMLIRALAASTVFFALASAVFVMHADLFIRIALGTKWASAVPISQVLFAALVPRCCYKVSETMMISFGYARSAAQRQAVYAILMIGGALLAVGYGPLAVAVASSIAITIFYGISLAGAVKLIGVPIGALATLHARAAMLFLILVVPDFLLRAELASANIILVEAISCLCSAVILSLVFFQAPSAVLGEDVARAKAALIGKVAGRLGRRDKTV